LYGCETWSLTLKKEHGLSVSENRVLRRIFGPKREEGEGHKILLGLSNQGERWVGHVARMGEMRNAYSILDGKPKGKRSLRRRRRIWEDNIGMHLMEIGWEDVDCVHLSQERDQ
jgi:hypothetical protein